MAVFLNDSADEKKQRSQVNLSSIRFEALFKKTKIALRYLQ